MKLRNYGKSAVDAVYDHVRNRDDNPVAVLPTGAGKSIVLAKFASDAVQQWSGRVLILAHAWPPGRRSAEATPRNRMRIRLRRDLGKRA